LIVPALTGPWAPKVAAAARIAAGQRVLDVACGTGTLSRHVASLVGRTGTVVGLDPGAGMLDVARRRDSSIEWREGAAGSLPFRDGTFDAVVSQFGLMFFPDRRAALQEALRVLVPGGRFAFAAWDAIETMPPYAVEAALLERLAGCRAAEPVRLPFVLGSQDALAALFREAGAAAVEVMTSRTPARFPSVRVMVESDVRGWLPLMGVVLEPHVTARILDEAERVLAPYVQPDGTVAFESSAHIVTGSRPG
jgi:SAM-dependent methyltransferase